ncbi:MAG: 2-hydroxychromene-2-carboxylate isomerase [Alteromonadaceae bacterium]|jgi:2-hydroxychromene-2-carboxylate isomerase
MRLRILWLKGSLRRILLTMRFYTLPRLLGKSATVDVYLALNDPHSFMLIQVLPEFEKRFKIKVNLYLIYESVPGISIDAHLLRQWAIIDANYIAGQYNLIKVKDFPGASSLITGQQSWQLKVKRLDDAIDIFTRTWFGEFDEHYQQSTPIINFQVKNQQRLLSYGHYYPGTLFFCGEWFTGVDRLEHLERRLHIMALNKEPYQINYQKNLLSFIALNDNNIIVNPRVLEAFISLHSPYAYIGLLQAYKLCKHYGIPLKIKPLLPMMTKNSVANNKQRCIFLDAAREAKKLNIPLKSFSDPLIQGVANCYQLFAFAEHKQVDFIYLKAMFEAIYVNNLDLSVSKNIELICKKIDLNYDEALVYAESHDWQLWSDAHQIELDDAGLWGVPCFRYRDISCWGQDRLVKIERAICEDYQLVD